MKERAQARLFVLFVIFVALFREPGVSGPAW